MVADQPQLHDQTKEQGGKRFDRYPTTLPKVISMIGGPNDFMRGEEIEFLQSISCLRANHFLAIPKSDAVEVLWRVHDPPVALLALLNRIMRVLTYDQMSKYVLSLANFIPSVIGLLFSSVNVESLCHVSNVIRCVLLREQEQREGQPVLRQLAAWGNCRSFACDCRGSGWTVLNGCEGKWGAPAIFWVNPLSVAAD